MHLKEGRYWTFNSVKDFAKLFSYWTEKQIETILNNLVAQGAILKGNFNRHRYDRTCWYTINDDSSLAVSGEKSVPPNGEMDFTKQGNPSPQAVEPIPDVNDKYKPNVIATATGHKNPTSSREEPKEEKSEAEPMAIGLDETEFESLAQSKSLDEYDQEFIANIVGEPLAYLTKKQILKLDKIRKKAANSKKIEKLRPHEAAFAEKERLRLEQELLQLQAANDDIVMRRLGPDYFGRLQPHETPDQVRKRLENAIRLKYS
ncbi:MAG: hypothetical protein AB7N80_01150 [Bdellovibrionales bacterium]